ncbi:MAG: hypothetical protein R3D68_02570 [Hyphomicrobiaceae bacterium]
MSTTLDILITLATPQLLLRMSMVAVFVVTIAVLAEKLGPFLGGMVASLPLYTGPIYLMLALERDAQYLWASTVGSIAICGANPVYVLAYCLAARAGWGTGASILAALGAWTTCAVIVQSNQWQVVEAVLFVAPIYAVAVPLAQGYTRGIAIRQAERGWMDLPLRAVLCGGLSGVVIVVSSFVPAQVTGILSVLPVLMTSLIMVLHPRIGGPATAALLAHTLGGLIGMVLAFTVVNLTILHIGPPLALGIGLAITVAWNISLIVIRRVFRAPAAAPSPPPPPPAAPPPLPQAWRAHR